MKIPSLLNPESREGTSRKRHAAASDSPTSDYKPLTATKRLKPHAYKKPKEIKDAPKYEQGEPIGPVAYPPFEANSDELRIQYQRFHITPDGNIAMFPRNIPYSSDKKKFHNKTGRDSFNAFQYTFRYRETDDDNEYDPKSSDPDDWRVVWDYNIGLVRITPFFKSQLYQKTIPAKAINMNPGLMNLCHSITGGALVAQGYWMPFEAAKALAATFCWKIRYALVPLFGPDFVDHCIDPEDPVYKRFTIDTPVIARCTSEVKAWKARDEGLRDGFRRSHRSRLASSSPLSSSSSPPPLSLSPSSSSGSDKSLIRYTPEMNAKARKIDIVQRGASSRKERFRGSKIKPLTGMQQVSSEHIKPSSRISSSSISSARDSDLSPDALAGTPMTGATSIWASDGSRALSKPAETGMVSARATKRCRDVHTADESEAAQALMQLSQSGLDKADGKLSHSMMAT